MPCDMKLTPPDIHESYHGTLCVFNSDAIGSIETSVAIRALKDADVTIGLIGRGGRAETKKFLSDIGLRDSLTDDDIFLPAEHASGDDETAPFEYFEHCYPNAKSYVYVADKDNALSCVAELMGWKLTGLAEVTTIVE